MIHLADETLISGPVRFRWMYPFERLMKGFKGLERNKMYINGCISRGYTLREASLYGMEGMSKDGEGTHKHTRMAFFDDDDEFADEMPLSKARDITLTQVQFEQDRKWLLSKYDGLDEWQRKYDSYVNCASSNGQRNCSSKNTSNFLFWLREELLEANEANSTLWRLVHGPLFKAQSYKRYQVNGFTYCAQDYEGFFLSQNSGVSMRAITSYRDKSTDTDYQEKEMTYYGVIRKIIKLNYMEFEEQFFYCDWVKVEDKTNGCKVDPNSKLIKVNLSKMKSIDGALDEPFIFASEATQVF